MLSIVRRNLLERKGYRPYCGNIDSPCSLPRTQFNGKQFQCRECGWQSSYEPEFIEQFKQVLAEQRKQLQLTD